MRVKEESEAAYLGNKILPEESIKDNGKVSDLNVEHKVQILSTFQGINVGASCENIVDQIGRVCERKQGTDLTKLAIFATHKKNSWGKCIYQYASECNGQIRQAIQACTRQSGRQNINFIQSDYPNYAPNGYTSVDIAYDQNVIKWLSKMSEQDELSKALQQPSDLEQSQQSIENTMKKLEFLLPEA